MTTTRRLAAILAADVVGYSKLMGEDETGTVDAVKRVRNEVLEPKIAEHQGRLFKAMGDGFLAEFPSVVDAVACAAAIQKAMVERKIDLPEDRGIQLRIGVNLGDVIVDGDDVFGDGVNVAARLEGIASPGEAVVSSSTHDQIGSRLDLAFEDMGEQQLKNIVRPVRVYRLVTASRPTTQAAILERIKPTIAVLPFTNMSGDAEQEYFADGMVEELITGLSRIQDLLVISRNSSFAYKGRSVDVRQIGRELSARYVLEGSVRKAGSRLRITGQLINTSTGAHLWAEKFEGTLENIFDLQDQVTARVVGSIKPRLDEAEAERIKHKPTHSLDAYDCYLRGLSLVYRWTEEANNEALSQFYRAFQIDPNYAIAYGFAVRAYAQRWSGGWVKDRVFEIAEVQRLARKAAELGHNDAMALCTAGLGLADVAGRAAEADALISRALILNPNLSTIWLASAWVKVLLGEPQLAFERIVHAEQLNPNDPNRLNFQVARSIAHLFAGQFSEAYNSAEVAVREHPGYLLYACVAAVSAALAGEVIHAEGMVRCMLELNPNLQIADVETLLRLQRPDHASMWIEGLRRAGVPN